MWKTGVSAVLRYLGCWSAPSGPRPEPQHPPAGVAEREHDAAAEAVVDPVALAGARHEPGVGELLVAEARAPRGDEDAVPGARRVPDPELAQHALLQPAALRGTRGRPGPRRTPTAPGRSRRRCARAARRSRSRWRAALGGARVLLVELELDAVAVGQELERALEVDPLRRARRSGRGRRPRRSRSSGRPSWPGSIPKDGERSSWNGHSPVMRLVPERRSSTREPTRSAMSTASRTRSAAGVGVARHQAAKDSGTLSASKARRQ